ncbi:hypothetical protein RN629_18240, partial [Sphingomonadaceae bacterium jetA1]|uniref:hypothetical protein n=1 Tax=Facivitalis istanbulensis TaxID=3075838 RepID=UPI0034854B6B
VDAASVYVAISRARTSAAVYIDSRASLTEALGLRNGAQVGAIDATATLPKTHVGLGSYQAEMA